MTHTDADVGPLFGQHTSSMPLRACVNSRPEHCWHLKESLVGNPPMQLCCWCAQWREIDKKPDVDHGPWRAKALEREGEGTE